jgi:hypothetical protein
MEITDVLASHETQYFAELSDAPAAPVALAERIPAAER